MASAEHIAGVFLSCGNRPLCRIHAATITLLSYSRDRTIRVPMREEITFVVEKDEDSDFLVASWNDPSGHGGINSTASNTIAVS